MQDDGVTAAEREGGAASEPATRVSPAKQRQRGKRKLILAAVVVIATTLALGWWPLSLVLVLVAYLANEVLLADHVFYDPTADYRYQFGGTAVKPVWQGECLRIASRAVVPTAILLRVAVNSRVLGRVLDPWVEMTDGVRTRRQFLERGAGGCRYINLSAFADVLAAGEALTVTTGHCTLGYAQAEVLLFVDAVMVDDAAMADDAMSDEAIVDESMVNDSMVDESIDGAPIVDEPLLAKRLLIIAPHADDAEIAAFGLYSQSSDCTIVTVTAGETDAEQFTAWLRPGETALDAARFKGEVRSLNAVSAGIWGGVPQQRCIALGYGCMQLAAMRAQPDAVVPSPYSGLSDTRPFRRANLCALPSDDDGQTTWHNLLADLASVVARCRPQVIVTAHPLLDKHPDHVNATRALWQVVQQAQGLQPQWLLYVNHLDASQDYPFGPAHSELGLPPHLDQVLPVDSICSVPLGQATQRRKALALDLMHDLKRPVRAKKWLRKRLQRVLLQRPLAPYGEDDFFRKAVRSSEVFLVAGHASMRTMMDKLDS